MYFKDLKASIAGSLALVITIGMVLVNIVIIALWQHQVSRVELDHARSILTVAKTSGNILSCSKYIQFLDNIRQSKVSANIDFFFSYDGVLYPSRGVNQEEVQTLLQQSVLSSTELERISGSFWSILGLKPKRLMLATPIKSCENGGAFAAVVKMNVIHNAIISKEPIILVYILVNIIILVTIGFFRMRNLVVTPLEKLVKQSETFYSTGEEVFDFTLSCYWYYCYF